MTVGEALADAARALRESGVETPLREARLLLAEAAALSYSEIIGFPERDLAAEAALRFTEMVERRARHEPLSRVLGRREFWSLPFQVTPDTLDPRPDTETIVEAALDLIPDRSTPLRLLDLGTGTGCILLALLNELGNATGIGVDRSVAAARVAASNARALGLDQRSWFIVADWGAALAPGFDLILSNPPYIPSAEIATLAEEVRDHDPPGALDGGVDGLTAYRRLAPALAPLLRPGGHVVFEVGAGQADAVEAILASAGLSPTSVRRDLAGIPRAIVARGASP